MDKYTDIQQEAIDERIDNYIRGAMTEEEETAFKQEIHSNSELRGQVVATLSLIKGIRNQDAEKENKLIDNSTSTKNKTRYVLLWACSIAAVFVISFGIINELRYRELSAIVSPYYSEYSMNGISRGDTDSVTVAHLYTLFNNVKKQRNVSDIIEELEPIYASLDSDFTYSAYANDIAWNLALAYIKDDQIDKAILVLEKLEADNPDMPIAIKACELKKQLQN